MYFMMAVALLFVLPAACILGQSLFEPHAISALMVGKWLAFWAVGMRLLLAGMRQMLQPRYTAEVILGLKSADALFVVRELGFANTALGLIGVGSILAPAWVSAATLAGTIFYGLAGINHLRHKARNARQNFAMVTDLVIALILAGCCAAIALQPIHS
jgi:hypothetical protein